MKDFNSVEYYGRDCDEKKYDAKETASFIENLERDFQDYQEKAKNLEICYERYYCNNSYVGTTAESSKEFISKRQNDEIHYENLNIQKEFLFGVSNIEDIFKEMVDSSPNAKIDSGVLGVIKREQQAYGDVFDKEGYELECWTRKMVDKFGRFGVTTLPDCSTIRIRYEELSGPGGHLDKCNKKLENFDDYSLEYLKQLGIKDRTFKLQDIIKNTANGLDAFTVYQPSMAKQTIELTSLNTSSFNPFKKFFGCKESTLKSDYTEETIIQSLIDQYGFTDEQAKLIYHAYKQYEKNCIVNKQSKTNKQKMNEFFSNLAALYEGYGTNFDFYLDFEVKTSKSSEIIENPSKVIEDAKENYDHNVKDNVNKIKGNFTAFNMLGTNPSTEEAIKFFNKLGVKGKALQEAINGQHFSCKDNEKRDFVHECAIIAVMSDTYNVKKWGLGIEDINAAIGYKGDVYSGSMDIDDKMSDVEAYNLYYRMKNCEDGNIWDVMTEYNIGVEKGSINGSKEFLEHFGKGDADKGLEKLKEELSEENLLTNILSKGVEDEDIENTKNDFLDYISKESGVY